MIPPFSSVTSERQFHLDVRSRFGESLQRYGRVPNSCAVAVVRAFSLTLDLIMDFLFDPAEAHVNFPFFERVQPTSSLTLDGALRNPSFCYQCNRQLFDAASQPPPISMSDGNYWYCDVSVPLECEQCTPVFGATAGCLFSSAMSRHNQLRHAQNFRTVRIRMSADEYMAVQTNSAMKKARDSRCLQLAGVQLFSRSDDLQAKRLAFVEFLPFVNVLQSSAALHVSPPRAASQKVHRLCVLPLGLSMLLAVVQSLLLWSSAPFVNWALGLGHYSQWLSILCFLIGLLPTWSAFMRSRVLPAPPDDLALDAPCFQFASEWKEFVSVTRPAEDTPRNPPSTAGALEALSPNAPVELSETRMVENGGVAEARISLPDPDSVQNLEGLRGHYEPMSEFEILLLDRTVDGRHFVSDRAVAWRSAPVPGNYVVFDCKSHHNIAAAQVGRIGGAEVPKAPDKFSPNERDHANMSECIDIILNGFFSQKKVNQLVADIGDVCDCGGDKYPYSVVCEYVKDIQADCLPHLGDIENFVKLETTVKPNKDPRLVQNNSVGGFVLAALIVKIWERGFKDYSINIKKRRRDDVMGEISRAFSKHSIEASLGNSKLGKRIAKSLVCVENDFTTYEYTQSSDLPRHPHSGKRVGFSSDKDYLQKARGFLTFEKRLMKEIGERVCSAIDQLFKIRAEKDGPKARQGKQVFKMRKFFDEYSGHESFWDLTLNMLVRRSGDAQTSIGNRVWSLLAVATAFLARPQDFFKRLVSMADKPLEQQNLASNWLFEARVPPEVGGCERPLIYFHPRAEGDDLLGHMGGWPDTTRTAPHFVEAERCLRQWGLIPKIEVVREGRTEFCGCHFLVSAGGTRDNCWAPDLARSLVKSGITTSEALLPAKGGSHMMALALAARAAGFRGRIPPAATYLDTLAYQYWQRAQAEKDPSKVQVCLDWQLSSYLGEDYHTLMGADAVWERLTLAQELLPEADQLALAEASLGGKITAQEWAHWTGAANGAKIDDEARLLVLDWPAALKAKCDATWMMQPQPA